MTDRDVIRALQCCRKDNCAGCPLLETVCDEFPVEMESLPAALLNGIEACLAVYRRVMACPDCNTCAKKYRCGYCPRPGEQTRINCPLWEKEPERKVT